MILGQSLGLLEFDGSDYPRGLRKLKSLQHCE